MEFLREVAHLRPRTNLIGAVTRVRHTHRAGRSTASSTSAASSGSTRRSSPLSDAEGAGQMFRVSTLDLANLPRTATARSTSRRTSSARRPT
jgi:asparaginyl-tRNA synthetase